VTKNNSSFNTKVLIIVAFIGLVLIAELIWWVVFISRISDEHKTLERIYVSKVEFLANHYYGAAENKEAAIHHVLNVHPDLFFDGNRFIVRTHYMESIDQRADKKKRMFIYETSVFFILIFLGVFIVYRSLRKELEIKYQQQNFMLSVTHELKTPLASIKLFLQTLLSRKNLSEERKMVFLQNSVDEVDRLNVLIENILQSVKLEANPDVFTETEYPLVDIIEKSLNKFQLQEGIKLRSDLDRTITHRIHPDMLLIVINNLVGNAIKYNETASIKVTLKQESHSVRLQVEDDGIGIPEIEQQKVFDRFYRVGSEETRNAKGTGLGLYIVEKIITACGGKIVCESNKPSGVIFRIELPNS